MRKKSDISNEELTSFLNWLKSNHCGKGKAIKAKDMDDDPRIIRLKVNALRKQGHPICSSSIGYYYAKNKEELNETLNILKSTISDIQLVISSMQANCI